LHRDAEDADFRLLFDQAAAILEWPNILFFEADALPGSLNVIDTIVQISNTSTEPVVAWCFYENANAHCTNTGAVFAYSFATNALTRSIAVEEDGDSYAGNALRKARAALAAAGGRIGLGDDSGLEVAALNGEPGLHSARWAGPTDADRNSALLARLNGASDRSAAFVCALAAALPDGREIGVTERVDGELASAPRGSAGFGYDPLFVPSGQLRTVAELSAEEKDAISHRGRASRALAANPWAPPSSCRRSIPNPASVPSSLSRLSPAFGKSHTTVWDSNSAPAPGLARPFFVQWSK
jgi:XTP/dITP diphosphohydrolase